MLWFVHVFCVNKLYQIMREISLDKFMMNSYISLSLFTLSCTQGQDL